MLGIESVMELPVKQLLDAAPDAMVIVDQSGHIVLVNKQTESLFGYSRDHLLGQTVETLLPNRYLDHHPEHRQDFLHAPCARPMGEGLELFGRRQNGEEFPIEISLSPVQTEQGAFVVSTIRDSSAQKEAHRQFRKSEERYRKLFENASDLIQSVRPDGSFIYVNPAWRKILGYSEEEIAAISLLDVILPDDHAYCETIFAKILSGESVDNIAASFIAKSGRVVLVEGIANCHFENDAPSILTIFHDVTQRATQLVETTFEAKQANASRNRLAQIVKNSVNEIYISDAGNYETSGYQ